MIAESIEDVKKAFGPTGYKAIKKTGNTEVIVERVNLSGVVDNLGSIGVINFKAFTPYQLEQAVELAKEGRFQDAANQQMAFWIPENYNGYIPSRGEKVMVSVGEYINKTDDVVLTINGIKALPAHSSSPLKEGEFDALFSGVEERVAVEFASKVEEIENKAIKA